jgi:hypothetical protein
MIKLKLTSKKIIAVIIVAILVISGIYIYSEYYNGNGNGEPEEPVKVMEDIVSPDPNQAIYLEIHRIRRKGIIDHMETSGPLYDFIQRLPISEKLKVSVDGIRPGIGWDEKPSFSYIATLDEYEEKGRETYRGWDTGYINNVIWRKVEDEKETTLINFKISENVKVDKLIGSEIVKQIKDEFSVMYDFKTGRWQGDDEFNDTDGYGHYDGANYEVWFSLTHNCVDEDSIPYWVEVNVLGTDPYVDDGKLDPDEDGIPTEWEWKWGYDPMVFDNHTILDPDHDGLQNDEEWFMEKWLANPYHPEIYIEADYMTQTPKKIFYKLKNSRNSGFDGWKHTFYPESQQMLMERFNEHGITIHIDDGTHGDMSRGGDILPFGRGNGAYQQDSGVVAGFYANNFDDERKGIFRYLVIAYGGGWCHPQDDNHWYDCMAVPHNYNFFKNQLGFALSERTIRIGQAISVMHELGHSLGMLYLHSGGVDNSTNKHPDDPNYPWFDYVSVMNYDYFWLRYLDYSNGENGEYDADDWGFIDLTNFQRPAEEMEGLGAL